MRSKTWVISFLALVLIPLILFAACTYILDPLLHYRAESPPLTYYTYQDTYSNPGIAKHYQYDTVLVGTSMIENTLVDECEEAFDCSMVRLSYAGGSAYDIRSVLDLCFASDNEIKTVYWNLDEHQLRANPAETRYPQPSYLYRNDHREDLSYLLNLDIFYNYTLPNIQQTLAGNVQPAARRGETFTANYAAATALKYYTRPDPAQVPFPDTYYMDNTLQNLSDNILPFVENNPDTEFVFFFVPYSMLYWDNEVRGGTFDASMRSLETAIESLIFYPNVRIYFFHDQWDIVTDLNNYKDYSHYATWVNSYMTQAIAKDEERITAENYAAVLEDMRSFVTGYDFESLFLQ